MPETNNLEKRVRELEQWKSAHVVEARDLTEHVEGLVKFKAKIAPWWVWFSTLGAFFGATAGAKILDGVFK